MADEMMEKMTGKSSLAILFGIPACGKTTFAGHLIKWNNDSNRKDTHLVHICYDDHIPSNLSFENEMVKHDSKSTILDVQQQVQLSENSVWKSYRKLLLHSVERLLVSMQIDTSGLPDYDVMEKDDFVSIQVPPVGQFWSTFLERINQKGRGCCCIGTGIWTPCCHVLVIDDNMFYRSMRYEYHQLARKYGIGYVQVFIDCPADIALLRNASRSDPVAANSIFTMASKLESPNPDKYAWEENSITFDGCHPDHDDMEMVMALIRKAAAILVPPQDDDQQHRKDESRAVNLASIIHQTDQVLRKIVTRRMEEAKADGKSKKELRAIAEQLNNNRKCLLEDLKKENSRQQIRTDRECSGLADTRCSSTSELASYGDRSTIMQMHMNKIKELQNRDEFELTVKLLFDFFLEK